VQFALKVVVLECSFLKHSQGILGAKIPAGPFASIDILLNKNHNQKF
jgi:hypothetical protein